MNTIELAGSAWDQENGPDARFWTAWRKYRDIEAAWDADPDESNEIMDRQGALRRGAFNKMMLIPVRSVVALAAKYAATEGECIELPGPARNTLTMIGWDLERLAKQELPKCEVTEEDRQWWRENGKAWFESLPSNV